MNPAVDIRIDLDSSWYGHRSLEDAPRVTISNTLGEHPSYNRSVQFACPLLGVFVNGDSTAPLISSDGGALILF